MKLLVLIGLLEHLICDSWNFSNQYYQNIDSEPPAGPKIPYIIKERSNAVRGELKAKLQRARSVSLTIDLWSNRQMKGFLGITGHFILDWTMHSVMISCKRFKGRHTAENIRQEYEEALAAFDIGDKICSIISYNASNMTKAFDFSLPGYTCIDEHDVENNSDDDDDDDDIEGTSNELLIEQDFPKHYKCYAHTLQLVVKDGLKDIGTHLRNVIEKAASVVKFVRKSVHASELLEDEKRLQSSTETRWNSQIIMIRSVLNIPQEKLDKVDTAVKLSKYERKLLQELCYILKPFEDATIRVQQDNSP